MRINESKISKIGLLAIELLFINFALFLEKVKFEARYDQI